ncbi:MAG: hypothetical protein ACXWLR_06680 [Myxococcales bacterium]
MLSNRSKKVFACNAIMIASVVLAWRCTIGGKETKSAPDDISDHRSFHRAQKDMRTKLNREAGDSGVDVADANTIVIGVVDNPNGKANLTRIPSEMHVQLGKSPELTWVCWDGTFTLTFRPVPPSQSSPLEGGTTVIDGGSSLPSAAKARVRSDAIQGRYNFTVHVDLADGGTADDLECPPIIID